MADVGRVAVVHDWLDRWRGGENVLERIVRLYPDAQLFALVDFLPDELRPRLLGKHARTSFLQHLPGARAHFRKLAPLFPKAIESLDLSAFDTVISSSHAVAKGVITRASQRHVCYCHTPMRYAWDLREQYLSTTGLDRGLRGLLARRMLDRLRDWDRRTSERVSEFIANSEYIAARIQRSYGREARVIYPPVDVDFFTSDHGSLEPQRREYFLTGSHWVPYKRIDLIVAAFRSMRQHRLVVTGSGPESSRIRAEAGPNVELVGEVSRERLRDLMRGARAFVYAAEEDFGIMPVEAQACGTPVIAYGRGGVLESVVDVAHPGRTAILFAEQSTACIIEAINEFEASASDFKAELCSDNAQRFSPTRFDAEFEALMAGAAPRYANAHGLALAGEQPLL